MRACALPSARDAYNTFVNTMISVGAADVSVGSAVASTLPPFKQVSTDTRFLDKELIIGRTTEARQPFKLMH